MKPSRKVWISIALASFALWSPNASAQYMYLDTDGDGVNTSADILSGSSPVPVKVYLRTDQNRSGSPTACSTGPEALSIFSWEFILRVSGGTVTWGALTLAGGGEGHPTSNAAEFWGNYFGIGDPLSPGLYLLGTVDVTPTGGSPVLDIVQSTTLSGTYLTSFGSECKGPELDHTMKLGTDWFDVDGTHGPFISEVTGIVFEDDNGTSSSGSCTPDPGEPNLFGWTLEMDPGDYRTTSDANGTYSFRNAPPGNYTVSVISPSAWDQTCPPAPAVYAVTLALGQTVSGINFGMKPAKIDRQNLGAYNITKRPKPTDIGGTYSGSWNFGAELTSVDVVTRLPTGVTYLSADLPSTYDPITNAVTTTLGTIPHYTWKEVLILYNLAPGTTAGTLLTSTTTANPITDDADQADNYASDTEDVVSSLDPNEKVVTPEGRILRDQTLNYHVFFQNTGTAPASNVVVRDTIDTDLNITSLQPGIASHPYSLAIQGRELIWIFTGIELPDSTTNEPASHGVFTYRIKPMATAPDGALIENASSIYFDSNDPVRTNTTTNVIDSAPVLAAVPDRTAIEGGTTDQPLTGSDAEGDSLTFTLVSGPSYASVTTTGASRGNLHITPQHGDAGSATVTIQASDGILTAQRTATVNVLTPTGVAETESFPPQEIYLSSSRSQLCLSLNPQSGSFSPADVDLSSVSLQANGSRPIRALGDPASSSHTACFSMADIRNLFADVRGTSHISVACQGALGSGESFAAIIPFTVHAASGVLAASVSPNPLNPKGALTFRTTKVGPARVQLFDVRGRLVRTLWELPAAPSGYHEIPLDVRNGAGSQLNSGVYFYRIEAVDGTQLGRIVVLR